MATEMGWVKAPFLTFVEPCALCFSSAACKKNGSMLKIHILPAESKTVSDTTPQCMSLSEQRNTAVGVVRFQRKLLSDLLGVCVNPVFHLLLRVCGLNPLIFMIYCCRESLEKCS